MKPTLPPVTWNFLKKTLILTIITFILFLLLNGGWRTYFKITDPPLCAHETCVNKRGITTLRARLAPSEWRGTQLNVDSEGWRVDGSTDELFGNFSENNYNLFIFGGSTIFGYAVDDEQTLPAYLESLLETTTVQGEPVKVYNLGQPGYALADELYLLV